MGSVTVPNTFIEVVRVAEAKLFRTLLVAAPPEGRGLSVESVAAAHAALAGSSKCGDLFGQSRQVAVVDPAAVEALREFGEQDRPRLPPGWRFRGSGCRPFDIDDVSGDEPDAGRGADFVGALPAGAAAVEGPTTDPGPDRRALAPDAAARPVLVGEREGFVVTFHAAQCDRQVESPPTRYWTATGSGTGQLLENPWSEPPPITKR
jgi:hypothetical protein